MVIACVRGVAAQEPEAPQKIDFLTRYDFHLSAAALSNDDQRFSWDTHFGGDLDALDYVRGRFSLRLDYQAMLGDELRAFDPNQGIYTLELSSSARTRFAEVAAVFHHVSRHLSDRAKTDPIAWNVLGIRALKGWSTASGTTALEVTVGRVTQHSNVDYTWTGDADVVFRRPLVPRASWYVRGAGQFVGTDPAMYARDAQAGGLVETGVRVKGGGGAVDLFLGYERRVDAGASDLQPQRWIFIGFRLVGG